MSFYRRSRSLPGRVCLILTSFLQRPGLPFADALPREAIQKAFDDDDASFADDEDAVYTPAIDFRRGRRLGKGDQVVEWKLPQKPEWMDQHTYDRMPGSIEIRQIHVHVGQAGSRTESFIVVTTLTNTAEYTKDDIAELYHYRWAAELDIRAIKITMGMDILRCKTPEMVRKEMWTCLLAYNLIRQTMLRSAWESGQSPRRLSFTAAMQSIAASWLVIVLSDDSIAGGLIKAGLANLTDHTVGNRPGRVEPRAVKRRPKPHDLLNKPRDQARAELLARKAS